MLLQCNERSSEIEIEYIFIKCLWRSERSREFKLNCTKI